MAEMERILGRFLAEQRPHLTAEICQRLLLLLQHSDLDLLDWLSGLAEPPEGVDRALLSWIGRSVEQNRRLGPC